MSRVGVLLVCAAALAGHASARPLGAGDPAQPVPVPAVAAKAVPARPAWPDEQFERWVFTPHASAAEAQRWLDAQLTLLIEDIDRACSLGDDQKDKIYLMGQGDIKRLYDWFERAKDRFRAINNDPQRLQQVVQDGNPLRSALQGGVFNNDSLVLKSTRHTLTADQMTKYDAVVRERQAFQHRATIQRLLAMIEQGAPLRVEQRRALADVLVSETKPPTKASAYDVYLAIVQVGRLPEQKVKPLLDDAQWKTLTQLVEQYREIEPALRQQGLIPNDDPAPVPPAKPGG